MPDHALLDRATTALLLFDMMERYRRRIVEADTIETARRLIDGCRRAGLPIFYVFGNQRPDGADMNRTLTDVDPEHQPWPTEHTSRPIPRKRPQGSTAILSELAPQPTDYLIPKHRFNAFYQSPLDLSLSTRNVDTILIAGGSTHVGLASTVYGARDRDYQVIVVSDACHGHEEQRLFLLERVFPRICRVRTVEKIHQMLGLTDHGSPKD